VPVQMEILRLRRKDEVGECDGEYRHAEEESVDDPLHLLFGLSLIRRRRYPSANDCSARLVCFHVAGSLPYCSRSTPQRLALRPRAACRSSDGAGGNAARSVLEASARQSVSRPLISSHTRSRRPRLGASPTVSAANSSTSCHRGQPRRRTAPPRRRRSGDYGIGGNERTRTD